MPDPALRDDFLRALQAATQIRGVFYAEAGRALDGLGDPWFRAGDAIRDPVENLRALAGFGESSGRGGAAA